MHNFDNKLVFCPLPFVVTSWSDKKLKNKGDGSLFIGLLVPRRGSRHGEGRTWGVAIAAVEWARRRPSQRCVACHSSFVVVIKVDWLRCTPSKFFQADPSQIDVYGSLGLPGVIESYERDGPGLNGQINPKTCFSGQLAPCRQSIFLVCRRQGGMGILATLEFRTS